jgi:hypothetical protein
LENTKSPNYRKVIQPIPIYELKSMQNFADFCNWWDLVISRVWMYENFEKKINILLVLNHKNTYANFKLYFDNDYYLIPKHP